MLERERARADRSGCEFSLLLLGVRNWETGRDTFEHLAGRLNRRLRAADEPGWFDGRHLGVILPSTPGWGAWSLADELCSDFPEHVLLPECKAFTYPSYWLSRWGERRQQLDGHSLHPEVNRQVGTMEPLFAKRLPIWKRAFDVLGAGLGLVLFSPLFLLAVLAVKLDSSGPVFFGQTRAGRGGRPFRMYKFRSMIMDAEAQKTALLPLNEREGPAFKISDDPRVTAVGRWLRKTSVDELPQLWNVLRGDMSLVGPRPLPCDESDACHLWHLHRLDVTPGITCTWQVRGRPRVSFTEWMRMDARYVRSLCFWGDLKLLLRTLPAVISGRNE